MELNTPITQKELADALLLSEFYSKGHIHFIPVGKSHINMLSKFRRKKWVIPTGPLFWKLSEKGKNHFFGSPRGEVFSVL